MNAFESVLQLPCLSKSNVAFFVREGVGIGGEGHGGEEVDRISDGTDVGKEGAEVVSYGVEEGVSWLRHWSISGRVDGGGEEVGFESGGVMVETLVIVDDGVGGGGDEDLEGEVRVSGGDGGGVKTPVSTGNEGEDGGVGEDDECEHCCMLSLDKFQSLREIFFYNGTDSGRESGLERFV